MLNINYKSFFGTVCLLCVTLCMVAQQGIGTFGNTYIHSNSEIGIHSKLYFNSGNGENPGIIVTNRNADAPGKVSFMKSDSWENATHDRHVDGYVKIYSDEPFTFPVGNMGHYKPISIDGAAGTSATYVYDDAVNLHNVDVLDSNAGIGSVSVTEYWIVDGTSDTRITLHWDESSLINELVDGNLNNLNIVGWNGVQWETIPSSIVSSINALDSDVNFGSIQTDESVVPSDYSVITFGSIIDAQHQENEFGSVFNQETIEMTVFPNPTLSLGTLNIDYTISGTAEATLVVIDGAGQVIYQQQLESQKEIMQLPAIEHSAGNYQVGIITNNNSRSFRTVVVAPE